ncbi:uncharacterized protein EI90DRAFT_3120883 [Cantharellus anzutake]|uniref:uncharacterized protein n=1 Tax=Cantharellus anzutake TaxID=1750568 RepID=UPI0019040F9F|nr:uncharacterized protein EI90DRAFT_3120883 [Cantharellus anzutake]KAF8335006.1 hypothetical protein EI90DRAFT_3120883 [Cantharellus anzutake]
MEHSLHAHLPLNVPSPVKAMMDIYRNTLYSIQHEKDRGQGWETDDGATGGGDNDDGDSDDDDNDDDNNDNDSETDGRSGLGTPSRSTRDVQRALYTKPAQSLSPSPLVETGKLPMLVSRTPTHLQLQSALQNASPTRALVNGTPSRTPASVPTHTFLHPTVQVNWNALPRPAVDIYDKLEKAKMHDEQYEQNDMGKKVAEAAKKACQDAQKDKEVTAAIEKQYKAARAQAWNAAKDEHVLQDVWKEYDKGHGRSEEGAIRDTEVLEPPSSSQEA